MVQVELQCMKSPGEGRHSHTDRVGAPWEEEGRASWEGWGPFLPAPLSLRPTPKPGGLNPVRWNFLGGNSPQRPVYLCELVHLPLGPMGSGLKPQEWERERWALPSEGCCQGSRRASHDPCSPHSAPHRSRHTRDLSLPVVYCAEARPPSQLRAGQPAARPETPAPAKPEQPPTLGPLP